MFSSISGGPSGRPHFASIILIFFVIFQVKHLWGSFVISLKHYFDFFSLVCYALYPFAHVLCIRDTWMKVPCLLFEFSYGRDLRYNYLHTLNKFNTKECEVVITLF